MAQVKYTENTHYVAIDEETDSQVIEEYFSYFCIHCHRFQSVLKELKDSFPEQVVFDKIYISHTSMQAPLINVYLAKVRLIAKKNKVVDEFDQAVFYAIHDLKIDIYSEKDLNEFLIDSGFSFLVSEAGIVNNEFNDEIILIRDKSLRLIKNKSLVSLPTLIVKGKYRINLSSLSSENIEDELHGLVTYLMSK